jgi:cysteine-rich repeat protein
MALFRFAPPSFFASAALVVGLGCAQVAEVTECADGVDNDGDGVTDLSDPGCDDENDVDEGAAAPRCGDLVRQTGEQCDGADFGGQSCEDFGFDSGNLSCRANCTVDGGGCVTKGVTCGNALLDAGEQCDGQNLGGQDCTDLGFGSGTLSCNPNCTFDADGCAAAVCGNGQVEGGEQCDDGNAAGGDGCDAACQNEAVVCGNNVAEPGEECDGADLAFQTCQSRGFTGGTLACDAGCDFDTSGCTLIACGNGVIEGGEQCDGASLGGQTCQSLGFAGGGTLSCSGGCTFNTAGCSAGPTCGNGVREGGEVCDGPDLGGQSCQSQGFAGGNLGCNGACSAFNTTGCAPFACSDFTDNDTDGFIDVGDPGCSSPTDNNEDIFADSCNGVGGPIQDISFQNTTFDLLVTGTTAGQPNSFGPTDLSDDCTQATGGELVFFYRNFANRTVLFSLDTPTTNYDTVLYIRQTNCGQGALEICNDDIRDAFGFIITTKSEMLVNLPAGDYFIFVDGFGGQAGNFQLLIDLPN